MTYEEAMRKQDTFRIEGMPASPEPTARTQTFRAFADSPTAECQQYYLKHTELLTKITSKLDEIERRMEDRDKYIFKKFESLTQSIAELSALELRVQRIEDKSEPLLQADLDKRISAIEGDKKVIVAIGSAIAAAAFSIFLSLLDFFKK